MTTAKIFENGRSQAVRLPKECRFSEDEVFVNKIGEIVMLIPKSIKWSGWSIGYIDSSTCESIRLYFSYK